VNGGLSVYILFNLLGIGCLIAILLFGYSPSGIAFLALACGAAVASLGMGSILAYTEIETRHRRKSLQISTE
jgi:hypothetical protein